MGHGPPRPGLEEGQLGPPTAVGPRPRWSPAFPRKAKVISKSCQPALLPLDPDTTPTMTDPPATPKPPSLSTASWSRGWGSAQDSLCPGPPQGPVSILPEGPSSFFLGPIANPFGASFYPPPHSPLCPSPPEGSLSLFLCSPQLAAPSVTEPKPPSWGQGLSLLHLPTTVLPAGPWRRGFSAPSPRARAGPSLMPPPPGATQAL